LIARRSATFSGDDAHAADAALGEIRRDLAAGHGDVDELLGHALAEIGLLVQEGQPARLPLFDDRDLDLVDQRQPPALEARQQRLAFGIVGGGRGLVFVVALAVPRVAFEDDKRAASPGLEAQRAGAHRMGGDLLAVHLHDLARHGAVAAGVGHVLVHSRPRVLEPALERVAVDGPQAGNLALVVERRALLQRLLAQRLEADQPHFLDAAPRRALVRRVGEALQRIDIVGSDQLAGPALERRVVGEEDARADAKGPGAELVGGLRHGRRRQRPDLRRPCQAVVAVQRFEDVAGDGARIEVRQLHRVEPGLGHGEGVAQNLGSG
jgi:hypothetical protein